ncbi:MAG: DUF2865 domain-containing protein [Hyphomicrobiaceae bacterium]
MLQPAAAQGGWWPWAGQQEPGPRPPPVPREPVWRGQPGQPGGPGGPPPAPIPPAQADSQRGGICLQLEQRLVLETQRGSQSRDQLPKIEADLRLAERAFRSTEAQLERSDCYEQWFLSRTLRKTRQCIDLSAQAEAARRRMSELDAQRQQMMGTRERSFQDDIIRELARNNCGQRYEQEARKSQRPFSSLWQDEDTGPTRGNEFGTLPFATYRTICVRLCDGYYFPVSFSTLENHFSRDIDICQSKCAAPAELFFYQNPGEAVEQARSVKSKQPYTTLKTAFLYRNKYVQGCSCKVSEYTPSPADRGDRRTEALPPAPVPQSPRQAQR